MVVMTAKVSRTKLIAVIAILAVIIIAAVFLLRSGDGTDAAVEADVSTNEGRIAYLSAYGWEVDPQPVETQEVLIPEEMNEVFERYNELQRSQGFDLTRFAGKQVKRYVYSVTNYQNATAPVYATLLISRGDVIGGDITSTAGAGLMHGFSKPESAKSGSGGTAAEPSTPPEEGAASLTEDEAAAIEGANA